MAAKCTGLSGKTRANTAAQTAASPSLSAGARWTSSRATNCKPSPPTNPATSKMPRALQPPRAGLPAHPAQQRCGHLPPQTPPAPHPVPAPVPRRTVRTVSGLPPCLNPVCNGHSHGRTHTCDSVHIPLVAAFCAQVVQVLFRVFRTHATCAGNSIHQGVFDIARHARRITANINVCAALQPRP